jgi:hypothetical protein
MEGRGWSDNDFNLPQSKRKVGTCTQGSFSHYIRAKGGFFCARGDGGCAGAHCHFVPQGKVVALRAFYYVVCLVPAAIEPGGTTRPIGRAEKLPVPTGRRPDF